MTYKLSPSAVNLFRECPRCFWLDKHQVWKRPAGIFPSLPSGMDNILKKHFDRFRDKGLLPPEICKNGNCNGTKLFGENEEEKELLKEWQSNFKGINIHNKIINSVFLILSILVNLTFCTEVLFSNFLNKPVWISNFLLGVGE